MFWKKRVSNAAPKAIWSMLPQALFDDRQYREAHPDIARILARDGISAFEYYVRSGHAEELAGLRQPTLPTQSVALASGTVAADSLVDRIIALETEKRALLELWDANLPQIGKVTFDMLTEDVDDAIAPPLDRAACDEAGLDPDQAAWRANGYVIKPGFFPPKLIDRYAEVRARVPALGGWSCPVPYMHVAELRDLSLYPPLMQLMERLVGEEMGLHLNLTGWVSTDRNWHQDDYLNPPYINSWYAAVWIALDDIHPDSGPFEFVPGSHTWPLMKSHRVRMFLDAAERQGDHWPMRAERFVNSAAEEEIARRSIPTQTFLARKGDVLVWHGRLMHRGSYANVPGMLRKTLIGHYSGLSHRIDMPVYRRTPEGSAYFVHDLPLDFDPYQ